jgi:hypothetical protein
MDANTTAAVVAIVVLAIAVGAIALIVRAVRSRQLRARYGAEYEHTVKAVGGRREAEEQLHEREKRVQAYTLTPLTPDDRSRFSISWRDVEATFVSNPAGAVARADELLTNVMAARGYPMADFDQRAADLSVDHADVVTNYRAAHDIATRHSENAANTEELRQAMIHYHALFDELVGELPDARSATAGKSLDGASPADLSDRVRA